MVSSFRLTAAVLSASLAGACFAEDRAAADLFSILDKNRDGKLEGDEVPSGQFRFFERLVRIGDMNQDGVITLQEFEQAMKADSAPEQAAPPAADTAPRAATSDERTRQNADLFQRLDQNQDGAVERDELPEGLRAVFAPVFDAAGGDKFSLEQLQKFRQQAAQRNSEPRPLRDGESMTGEGSARPGFDGRPGMRERFNPLFIKLLDQNLNGKLSREELSQAVAIFEQLDVDSDGEISRDELLGLTALARESLERNPAAMGSEAAPSSQVVTPAESQNPLQTLFSRIDQNGDYLISRDEAPTRLRELFPTLDKDQDGRLTPSEFRAGLDLLRQQGVSR